MAADPADILRATRRVQTVTRTDTGLLDHFPLARDGAANPEPGFFETAEDARAALAIKAGLIGVARRRFLLRLAQEFMIDPLVGVPTATLRDDELAVFDPVLVTRVQLDLENETTMIEVMG